MTLVKSMMMIMILSISGKMWGWKVDDECVFLCGRQCMSLARGGGYLAPYHQGSLQIFAFFLAIQALEFNVSSQGTRCNFGSEQLSIMSSVMDILDSEATR